MSKRQIIFTILFAILFIVQIICLIQYCFKYKERFSYKEFMLELKSNDKEHYSNVYYKFEKFLGHYCGRSELGCFDLNLNEIGLFFQYGANIFIGIIISQGVLLFIYKINFGEFTTSIKKIIIIILAVAGLFNIFDIYNSFDEYFRIDLNENQIYIYTDDINKKIRDTLDKLNIRAIYMTYSSFAFEIICILEIIIVLLFTSKKNSQDISPLLQDNNNHDNKNNIIGQGLIDENQNLVQN